MKTTKDENLTGANAMLSAVGGAVKIYEALYTYCIYESAMQTLSLHKTKEGAEKAVQAHKDKIKKEHDDMNAEFEKEGLDKSRFEWDVHQRWDVQETELLD